MVRNKTDGEICEMPRCHAKIGDEGANLRQITLPNGRKMWICENCHDKVLEALRQTMLFGAPISELLKPYMPKSKKTVILTVNPPNAEKVDWSKYEKTKSVK